jgi:hypothetical protein
MKLNDAQVAALREYAAKYRPPVKLQAAASEIEPLFTLEEAVRMIDPSGRLTLRTLQNAISRRELGSHKLGRVVYTTRSFIRDYLEATKVTPCRARTTAPALSSNGPADTPDRSISSGGSSAGTSVSVRQATAICNQLKKLSPNSSPAPGRSQPAGLAVQIK